MAEERSILDRRRVNPVKDALSATGLYHSFVLPDGTALRGSMPLEWQLERLSSFRLPEDLSGKRVLDIGPWDGFFTFELEKRGAEVTAIDYVDLDTFRMLHRAFHSKARYLRMDVYELDPGSVGVFDIVLCLGTLYHFKHPLLALERICAVTSDRCIIDTFVIDGKERRLGQAPDVAAIEFYEREELGGQLDNWCGPTVSAVEALARAAGFARTELLRLSDDWACVGAHRRWADVPPDREGECNLTALTSHMHRGRCFSSAKEEYIALWCAWNSAGAAPPLDQVFPEIDGHGSPPLSCTLTPDGLAINVRVPPGLNAGKHQARVKIGNGRWSERQHFYVDLPPITTAIRLVSVQDGVTWSSQEVDWGQGGWVTVWIDGLSEEADAGNTVAYVSGIPHFPDTIDIPRGQINFRLRPVTTNGEHDLWIVHRRVKSNSFRFRVTGAAPAVRGLERLAATAPS